jgi:hypothetical protein
MKKNICKVLTFRNLKIFTKKTPYIVVFDLLTTIKSIRIKSSKY